MKQIISILRLLFVGFSFSSAPLFAQEADMVRGKVAMAQDNSPIPGASVAEIDKDHRTISGTVTDMNGNYALRMKNTNDSLSFSFIGLNTVTMPVNGRKTIDVALTDAAKQLDEVVIVGKQKVNGVGFDQRDIAASVQKISTQDLQGIAATSIDDALQGRLAGVDITASSGAPGAGMSIRIRGASSLNASTKPLIVVDDVIFETEIGDFDFADADEESYAQMLSIAPDDIKDITVLIDPASTSRWGTRGANGVLYITTKRGEKGAPKLNYSFRGAASFMPNTIPLLSGDEYSTMIAEGVMNVKGIPLNSSTRKEFQYDPNDPWWYYNYSNNTNWIDEITRVGFSQEHNLSLSGGGDKATYRISLGYLDQKGTVISEALKRINTRINLDYMVSDKLIFRTSFAYTRGDNDKSYTTGEKSFPNVLTRAYTCMPNMSVYERSITGAYSDIFLTPEETDAGPNTAGNAQGAFPNNYNPVALARLAKFNILNNRITPNFQVNYNILKGLTFYGNIAFDISNDKTTKNLPQNATGRPVTDTYAGRNEKTELDYFSVESNASVSYATKIGNDHDFSINANTTIGESNTPQLFAQTANAPSSELQDPTIPGNTVGLSTSTSKSRTLRSSVAGQYKFRDKYIITGGINREGNSKLAEKYRYGYFPNVGVRYRISDEGFMKGLTFIQELSLRGTYAITGNLDYKKQTILSNYDTFGWDYLGVSGVYQTNPELADLKWEQIYAKNLAADLVLKGGYTFTFDYYNRTTEDMLNPTQNISSTSGYTSIANNIGTINVQGWSVNFKLPVLKSQKGLNLDFSFNIANEVNRLRKLSSTAQETGDAVKTITDENYKTYQLVDRPIGSFYGYKYMGVYSTQNDVVAMNRNGNQIVDASGNPVSMRFNYTRTNPGYNFQAGDAIYQDINHDGNIDYMDIVYLGNSNPLFYGGFNFALRWKGVSCNLYFNYRYGNDVVNMTKSKLERMSSYDNQSEAVLRRWRNPGDVTDIPRALIGGENYNYLASDRFVEDGSFVRLKTLYVSYLLPRLFTQKLNISTVSVFGSITNLLTLTNYTGQDPEIKYDGGKTVGTDNSMTPRSYDLNFGLNLTF